MNSIKIVLSFLLKYKIASLLAITVMVGLGWWLQKPTTVTLRTTTVMRGTVRQEISATGRIKAADTVGLAFEKSGRVTAIPVKEGQKVSVGTLLIQLDSQELFAQRSRELANVQSAEAKLAQLLYGTRPEDIQVAQTTVENAQRVLDGILTKDVVDTARTGINSAINGMVIVSTIQNKYTYTIYGNQYGLGEKSELAMQSIYGRTGLGGTQPWYFLPLHEGLKTELAAIEKDPLGYDTGAFLKKIKLSLTLVKDALDATYGVASGAEATDADKASITTARTDVLTKIDAITTQEQSLISAKNTLGAAQSSLDLKKAPATSFDVDIAKSNLTQAQASLALVEAQLAKQFLRSPISGTVAKVIARRGEIVAPNTPVISVISDAKFQIEANIPEADIAKVKLSDSAKVTLDAYGQDIIFDTHLISIDPGETIVEGVATYKVTFEFDKEDSRILSGLTANIDVLSSVRENVLYIPTRDITSRSGKKYVTTLVNLKTQETEEMEVTVGLKGSDGRTEITSGLSEGDTVVE